MPYLTRPQAVTPYKEEDEADFYAIKEMTVFNITYIIKIILHCNSKSQKFITPLAIANNKKLCTIAIQYAMSIAILFFDATISIKNLEIKYKYICGIHYKPCVTVYYEINHEGRRSIMQI